MESSNIERGHPRWSAMWNRGINPGDYFDASVPSPALVKYFHEGIVPDGRILVPGCGRGYDVTFLASESRYVLGLDIAEKAIEEAKLRYQNLPEFQKPPIDKVEFSTKNFFDLDTTEELKFNFVYDYTFLCALDPKIRIDWALKMSQIIKTNGTLFCVIFPIQNENIPGPPYSVSLDLYKNLLLPVGFKIIKLEILPKDLCHPGRDGTGDPPRNSGIGIFQKQ